MKQLATLKKDTKLTALEKVEKLKLGSAINAKIAPILDPEQQKTRERGEEEALS